MKFLKSLLRNKKGAALVEYGLLVAGVALVAAAAVSVFGHKTNDLLATTAGVLPGAGGADNNPIAGGRLIETNTVGPNNALGDASTGLDLQTILQNSGKDRLGNNMGFAPNGAENMVFDTP